MSLLMDALRRAEEEKRRAAARTDVPPSAPGDEALPTQQPAVPVAAPPTIGSAGAEAVSPLEAPAASGLREPIDAEGLPALALEPLPGELPPLGTKATSRPVFPPSPGEDLDAPDLVQPGSTTIERALAALGLGGAESRDPDATRESHRPGQPGADATLPSERVLRSSLREFFDTSQSVESDQPAVEGTGPTLLREGATAPGRGAPEPLEVTPQVVDHRTGQSQRATAQAVLTAAHRRTSSRLFSLLVVGLFLVATTLGAVGFYYYARTLPPPPRLAQAARNAAGIAPALPPAPAPAPAPDRAVSQAPVGAQPALAQPSPPPSTAPAPAGESGTPAAASAGVGVIAEPVPGTPPSPATAPGGVAAITDEPTVAPGPVTPPLSALTEADGAVRPSAAAMPDHGTDLPEGRPAAEAPAPLPRETIAAAPPRPTERPPPSTEMGAPRATPAPPLMSPEGMPIAAAVRISRSSPTATIAPGLMQAFEAWRRGDLAAAERGYRAVLAVRPTERDALLGLAGVAVARKQTREAIRLYQSVLRLEPRNSVASAALHLLQGGDGPGLDTATLQLMLDEEPAAAHLHFALGNHHARTQRWGEAQAAYFEAWRLEVDNPDYAFNLAVALDQLGQARAAIEYYQRALKNAAASGRRPSFDVVAVEARLRSLQATRPP